MPAPGAQDKVTVEHVAPNSHAYSKLTEDRHFSDVRALAFSPDSRLLASGDNDGQIKIWNLYTEKVGGNVSDEDAGTAALGKNRAIPVPSGAGVVCLTFCPHGRYLAVSCRDHRVHVFNTQSLLSYVSQMWFKLRQPKRAAAQTLRTLYSPLPAPLRTMAYASTAVLCVQWCLADVSQAEGKSGGRELSWLLAGCDDGTVRARRLRLDPGNSLGGNTPKSAFGFNSGEYDTEHVCFVCHSAPVLCLTLDKTSAFFATGSEDGSLKVWTLPPPNHPSHTTIGTCIWTLKPPSPQGQLQALSWSPNGAVLASAFSSAAYLPAHASLLDSIAERAPPPPAPPVTPSASLASVLPPVAAPALRPDQKIGGVIKKIEKGVREIQAAKRDPPTPQAAAAVSTSEERSISIIEVWDIVSQSCLAKMTQDDTICVTSLAWSSDCRILASVNHCREEQYPLASSPLEDLPGKSRSSHIKLWGQTRKDGPRCFQVIQPHLSTRCMIAGLAISLHGCCVGFAANNMVGMVNIDQPAGAKPTPAVLSGPSANTKLLEALSSSSSSLAAIAAASSPSPSSSLPLSPASPHPPPVTPSFAQLNADDLLVQCLMFEETMFRQYVIHSNRFKRMCAGHMKDEQGKPYPQLSYEEANKFMQYQIGVCFQLDLLTSALAKTIQTCAAEKTFYLEIMDSRSSQLAGTRQQHAEDKMQNLKKLKNVMSHSVTPAALLFLLDPAAHWSIEQSNGLVAAPTAPFIRSSVPLVVSAPPPPPPLSVRGAPPAASVILSEWSCEYCTTINKPSDDLCDACQSPRSDHERKLNAASRPWFESLTAQGLASSPPTHGSSLDLYEANNTNMEMKSSGSVWASMPQDDKYELDNKHGDAESPSNHDIALLSSGAQSADFGSTSSLTPSSSSSSSSSANFEGLSLHEEKNGR